MTPDVLDREWRRIRRRSIWAVVAMAALIAALAVPTVVFGFPPRDFVSHADAIFVLGPPTPLRMAEADRLRAAGISPVLLVSVAADGWTKEKVRACSERMVTCEIAAPSTTKGEVLLLNEYAPTHDVQHVVVITTRSHVARTRYIFQKCFPGETSVEFVDELVGLRNWVYQVLYQSAAFVKAWATPCAQLED
jgi:uncharacterized SAM-binding protein YcdF (DUF218 family)